MVTYQGSSARNYVKNMHQRTQTRNRMCKLFRGFLPYSLGLWGLRTGLLLADARSVIITYLFYNSKYLTES